MSLFDKLRRKSRRPRGRARRQDRAGPSDKGADVADDKTGGKYTEQIDSGVETTKEGLDKLDGRDDDIGARPPA